MDRTKLACFGLLASAFVLAALLIVRLPAVLPAAQAHMVDDKDRFSIMTAQTRAGQESLFVIDELNEKLMVYDLDSGRGGAGVAGSLQLMGSPLDLGRIFGNATVGGPARLRP